MGWVEVAGAHSRCISSRLGGSPSFKTKLGYFEGFGRGLGGGPQSMHFFGAQRVLHLLRLGSDALMASACTVDWGGGGGAGRGWVVGRCCMSLKFLPETPSLGVCIRYRTNLSFWIVAGFCLFVKVWQTVSSFVVHFKCDYIYLMLFGRQGKKLTELFADLFNDNADNDYCELSYLDGTFLRRYLGCL